MSIPETMRAVFFEGYGDVDQVKFSNTFKVAAPTDDEVLIRVHATSINPIDWKVLSGYLKSYMPKTFPVVMGWDCAGEIAQVGKNVKDLHVGDQVIACTSNTPNGGSFADYCCVRQQNVSKKPHNLSFTQSAALPVVGSTAVMGVEQAKIPQGGKLLVLGGSGGVGMLAVQVAKAQGYHVAATCSTQNVDFVKSLGADVVIDYKTQKWEEVLHDYDAVYDAVGAAGSFEAAHKVVKKGGNYLGISGAPLKSTDDLHFIYLATAGQNLGHALAELTKLVEAGKVRTNVDKVYEFKLDQVVEMIKYSKSERARGKLILSVVPDAQEEKKHDTMKALYIGDYGEIEQVLHFGDLPVPQPADDEILIQVHAASINPIDWKIVSGKLQNWVKKEFPLVLGWDVAGVVTHVGKSVQGFKVGDEVFADTNNAPRGGSFAQYCCAKQTEAAHKPKNVSFTDAAAVPVVALTAYQALKTAHLAAGAKVLVLGGSGGVGSAGVQVAKALGATHVAATCGTASIDLVKNLGAEEVVDYKTQKWEEVLAGKAFDIVLDTVGVAGSFEAAAHVLKKGGVFVAVAGGRSQSTADVKAEYVTVAGLAAGQCLAEVAGWIEQGKFKPLIDTVYDFNLEKGVALVKHSMSERAKGKLVLAVVKH